uniref:Uncharacterized protein n=1 Tax=Nelumbo nucifera TaxID=4432 RepID=A0A822XGF8_NELNU|nr:TPA_asm: hypothetical protein HUJ06_022036 [Nelumbo nucifera]
MNLDVFLLHNSSLFATGRKKMSGLSKITISVGASTLKTERRVG